MTVKWTSKFIYNTYIVYIDKYIKIYNHIHIYFTTIHTFIYTYIDIYMYVICTYILFIYMYAMKEYEGKLIELEHAMLSKINKIEKDNY